jgi:hypothetical protein
MKREGGNRERESSSIGRGEGRESREMDASPRRKVEGCGSRMREAFKRGTWRGQR